jgi:hypothetical protein
VAFSASSFLQLINELYLKKKGYTPKASDSDGAGAWFCYKSVSDTDKGPFVIRGCIPAISNDMPGKCEYMDYDYNFFGNITIDTSTICFCDSEGCNSALYSEPQPTFIAVTFLLSSSWLSVQF